MSLVKIFLHSIKRTTNISLLIWCRIMKEESDSDSLQSSYNFDLWHIVSLINLRRPSTWGSASRWEGLHYLPSVIVWRDKVSRMCTFRMCCCTLGQKTAGFGWCIEVNWPNSYAPLTNVLWNVCLPKFLLIYGVINTISTLSHVASIICDLLISIISDTAWIY